MEVSEHLRGPWKAFLVTDDGGKVFSSLTDVPNHADAAVAVLRGEALAVACAGSIPDDSVLPDLDVLYTVTPDYAENWAAELPVRWSQAQAVAEALNERTELERLRAVVRRVVSITQDTGGDPLGIDETVPVGEVLRMLYEFHEDVVERACLSRSANEPGA